MKIAEMFVKLGLDGQQDVSKGLKTISGSLKELFSMSIQTKLTLAGIAGGLTAAAFSAGKTGKELMGFKYAFDLSTKEMQKFSWATRQFGIDNQEAMGYIEGLQDALAQARQGGGMAKTFTALGIDITQVKDAFELSKIIADRAKGANADYYRTMGDLMSPAMVAANRMMAERGGLQSWMNKTTGQFLKSESQLEQQRKISVAFENFSQNLKNTMDNFIVKNEPLITKLIANIEKLLETFLRWTGDAFEKTGIVKDVVEGKGVGTVAVNASARIGQGMVDLATDTIKDTVSMVVNDYKAAKILSEADEKAKKRKMVEPTSAGGPGWVEVQQGNTSTFYINGIDVNNQLKKDTKDDIARLVAFNLINKGNK